MREGEDGFRFTGNAVSTHIEVTVAAKRCRSVSAPVECGAIDRISRTEPLGICPGTACSEIQPEDEVVVGIVTDLKRAPTD